MQSSKWYQRAVIYQIYPRSFSDSNGDGIGDLAGITSRLNYLSDLGVDAIWLSPVYTSPMVDFGYDVANYCDIDPTFGTIEDFDELVEAAHSRGIKVLMDLIPNHTSNEHPWFIEAATSRSNPKRDWYIWKDPRPDGGPPNNWQSVFGGPSWTLDKKTGQYYLHSFLSEQPDLNWNNSEVRSAIQDVMRFWYEKGVDGFRVDAILFTSKDIEFRDNPTDYINPDPSTQGDVIEAEFRQSFSHGVGAYVAEYIGALETVTLEYPDRCLFLEAYPDAGGAAGYAKLYSYCNPDITAFFNFGLLVNKDSWKADSLQSYIDEFQAAMVEGTPAYVFGNHDAPRLASRIGNLEVRPAALLLLTLPGTSFIYYGEELGMEDVHIDKDKIRDPSRVSRDPERTPMQWTSGANAGFSKGEPWLPLSPSYEDVNVEDLSRDENSIWTLYQKLIRLRKDNPALRKGRYKVVENLADNVMGFELVSQAASVLVIINFSADETEIGPLPDGGRVLLSTLAARPNTDLNSQKMRLLPREGLLVGYGESDAL